MTEITQNNILFKNIEDTGVMLSSYPILINNNIGNGKAVNAVDINWNGAEVDENVSISYTGELLSWIKSLSTTGPQGPQGEQGPQGPQGEQGPQGLQGETGTFDSSELENYALKTDLDNKVNWTESTPGRNHIVLKNHDSVLGTAADNISTYNLVMLSKWDVADFGSNQIHLNLNSVDGVTLNDNEHIATTEFVNEKISEVVGAAPEALDTLKEIGDKLAEDNNAVSALTSEIANKANAADVYTKNEADAKFLTEHQDISGLATAASVAALADEVSNCVTKDELGTFDDSALEDYATKEFVIGTVETLANYEYIHDEDSWNASYANGVLKKYYASYPDEDLESTTPGKEVGFNDRIYVGTITGSDTIVRFKATWQAKSQLITNLDDSSETYYMERLDKTSVYYGTADELKAQYPKFQEYTWALYSDADLTIEVGKEFAIESLEFDGFIHTYNAWLNNGAQLPWICINFDTDVNAKIAFTYEGKKDVYPWLDKIFGTGEGHKTWGIASIPAEFIGDNSINNFDPSKFEIKLVSNTELDSKYVSKITYDALLDKFNKLSEKVNEIYNELHP